ncbi:OLFML2B [Branchiostoma lanceolatum]|nr:OLFML2B [Branchiostoma lanceolatum]
MDMSAEPAGLDELLHPTTESVPNFTTPLQPPTTVAMTTTIKPSQGPALACQGPVTSFAGRQAIQDDRDATNGALLRDHSFLPDNAEKVWYLPTFSGNTIEEYRTMDDFVAGNVSTTYRLPGSAGRGGMAWWGQGHVVYNNSLYYQRYPDCMSYGYDCSNEKAQIVRYDLSLRAFTALQSLPVAQLSPWAGGPSHVYLAVYDGGVWVIGVNNGILHLTKLNANDLSVEETIDTEYTFPSSNIPPFIACGKLYVIVPDTKFSGDRMQSGHGPPRYARTAFILDLSTKQKDTATEAWYCLPMDSRRYFSFNSRETKVYTVERNAFVSYNVTIGGPYLTDPAMFCSF